MASIRNEAQRMLNTAKDGVGWIAVWKEGRGWRCEDFYPEVQDEHASVLRFDAWDFDRLERIGRKDPMAVIVNSWYQNLGDTACMTRDSLAACLQWHYRNGTYKVEDALAIN